MRPSRSLVLSQSSGIVHLFWRCHNKESLLDLREAKKLFFECLIFGLKHRDSNKHIKLHAFCFMSNHVHKQMSYENGSSKLSHVMRVAHGRFGLLFNRKFKRSGKVANERPKTPLIGDLESQMRVHFYIEANPVRANLVKLEKLRFYFWNSYRYFAHGVLDEVTEHVTPPDWYIRLGNSTESRQREYRRLFRIYLKETPKKWSQFFRRFIGTPQWMKSREELMKKLMKARATLIAQHAPE